MSDSTEVSTGSAGASADAPALFPASGTEAGGAHGAGAGHSGPDTAAPASGPSAGTRRRSSEGIGGMLLPELQRLAQSLGMTGTGRMRKGELVAAIQQRQGGGQPGQRRPARCRRRAARCGGSFIPARRARGSRRGPPG